MLPNINPKTQIAFGVIDARKAMELWDEIQREGVNTTLKNAEDDVKGRLRANFAEFDAEEYFKGRDLWGKDDEDDEVYEDKADALIEWLDECVRYATELRGRDSTSIAEEAICVVDVASGTFDIEELVDEVMSLLQEDEYFSSGDSSEDCYDYESGGFTYHLSCLGGAAMIWVYEGPYATYCRTCSPCVRNAGDLDNCTDELHGNNIAYCLDPADIEDDADKPEVLYRVDAEGEMTKIEDYVKPKPPEEAV